MVKRLAVLVVFVCLARISVVAQISQPPFRYVSPDSVITYPSGRYQANSFLHALLMGKNYRKVWSQPVQLPVFRLSKTSFSIDELGGGMQTKSLKLKDPKGQKWALRSVDKDVSGAISGFLKNTFVKDVAQDHISAAMPYAAPVVADLLRRTDVTTAEPTIYFVADDLALGPYRHIFANTVCMLEERDADFDKTDNTKEMLANLQQSNKYIIDQRTLLQARLFDMLIADWDRHYDNWRWGKEDSAGMEVYKPLPRDRDWAFYNSNGLVPELVRLATLRFLVDFDKTPGNIKNLSLKAWAFDGAFLNGMNRKDWQWALTDLRQTLTDAVIERAVKKLPTEVYALIGTTLIERLKARRDHLEKGALDYYGFLARNIQIDGTNDADIYLFEPAENGVQLQIYRQPEKNSPARQKIYERTFLNTETFSIMINGLGGNDVFQVAPTVSSKIKLILNGGTGTDTYDLQGSIRGEVHDYAAEQSVIPNKSCARLSFY